MENPDKWIGTTIEGAKLTGIKGVNDFYFCVNILTEEDRQDLTDSITITADSGVPLFRSNPYNCNLGDIKLYKSENGSVLRCKILDMYCTDRGNPKALRLCVDLSLIDSGRRVDSVWYDRIFDLGQVVGHCLQLEPEAKPAVLDIDYTLLEGRDNKIDKIFRDFLANSKEHKVKIINHQGGLYHVDIILPDGESLASLMNKYFSELSQGSVLKKKVICDNYRADEDQVHFFSLPIIYPIQSRDSKALKANRKSRYDSDRRPPRYVGALEYFKKKLNDLRFNDSRMFSWNSKRFFQVKVISWLDPDNISIIPDDEDYIRSHTSFRQTLDGMPCVGRAENESELMSMQPFGLGEKVLFKNTYLDPALGNWLRGTVIAMSFYGKNNLSVHSSGRDPKRNLSNIRQMIKDGILSPDDVVYRVKAIDYGYEIRSSHFSMRHLTKADEESLSRIVPWSLSCSLYGVYPLPTFSAPDKLKKGKHSISCIGMMDSWLREQILTNSRIMFFNIFFRTPIRTLDAAHLDQMKIEISLFHRHQTANPIVKQLPKHLMVPTKSAYYRNLNWFLVELGVASDSPDYDSESSQIQLEECIVNKLVKCGKL